MPVHSPKIISPLFESNAKNPERVLQRLVSKLGAVGIGKMLHSLRHRAKGRLRAEGCPIHLQYELLEHEIKTVASGYGHDSSMAILKPMIGKTGLVWK